MVTRLFGQRIAAGFSPEAKQREVWAAAVQVARLSDDDQGILRGPVVLRLAELEVSPETDLWLAVGAVLVGKWMMLSTILDPAQAAETASLVQSLARPAAADA